MPDPIVDLDMPVAAEDNKPAEQAIPVPPVESAKAKVRAFEDEVFGPDVPRINGEIERGIGSPYSRMNDKQKAHYAALENLVAAEKAVAAADAKLAEAKAAHEAAAEKSANAEKIASETE